MIPERPGIRLLSIRRVSASNKKSKESFLFGFFCTISDKRQFDSHKYKKLKKKLKEKLKEKSLSFKRVKGIEPSYSAWEADVLPLNYTRKVFTLYTINADLSTMKNIILSKSVQHFLVK